ncbi:MAG: class I SAM-dependent methyltransferase [Candidatus Moranbacteria bacterium]|nr:class I SAM-dependent methyltransferase [Candidatus Moranbacteria bacterium]
MIKCRCCSADIPSSIFSGKILGKSVSYFDCINCGYVQTEEPTWLEDAYSSSINSSDTGIMARNLSNVSLVLATLLLMRERKSRVVDFAGGHGFLVRLLRDAGVDVFWADPYSENLVAKGFEHSMEGQVALVTAFEAFEHFVDPCSEMGKLLSIAPNILFTTNIVPTPTPQPKDWWYYGLDHGQHVGFFRLKTLKYLACKFDLYLLSDGFATHLFSKKKYSYRIWRILIKFANILPSLLSVGLRSKTWDDHLYISQSLKIDHD